MQPAARGAAKNPRAGTWSVQLFETPSAQQKKKKLEARFAVGSARLSLISCANMPETGSGWQDVG
jgi:hypothetical protein